MSITVGELCYFESPEHSWIVGTVEAWDEKKGIGKCRQNDAPHSTAEKLSSEQIFIMREDLLDEDVDDLLRLTLLHDSTILNVLKRRYFNDIIYTNIGAIVVALNPFNFKIPHYTPDNIPKYLEEGDRIENNLPHSWAVAHNTYWEMMNDNFNQCILVSGESGAGKTEASKIVMTYLTALSCKTHGSSAKSAGQQIGVKINSSSAPLESFGNARTVRNDNSSRFGKFMKVKFSADGALLGAHITKYLLEKSRIVTASQGERVYHSFYLLLNGSDAATYELLDKKEYRSVSSGNQWDNKEYTTSEEYTEVVEAMATIGMDQGEVAGMWSVVAALLNFLNVDFEEEGEGSIISPASFHFAEKGTELLEVDTDVITRELVSSELEIQGQKIVKLLPPVKARDSRDAMVKALYDSEFGWLVEKCNAMLDTESSDGNWIGLLDIFGFEDFEVNSFEQFCINLANETLQGHYNQFIFTRDMVECRAEGINVDEVTFPDNSPCLQMMVGKGGISALLDEECSLGKGSDLGFLDKITDAHSSSEFFLKKTLSKSSFVVHHYAGSVTYEVENFLEKNRDTLKDAVKLAMRASTKPFVAGLLAAPVEKSGPKLTVGGFFKTQLKALMDLINSTNPHWIRCVKPHPAKKPKMFCGVSTMHQLASAGVLGTVKIRKAGFPVRIRFEDFVMRYGILLDTVDPAADPLATTAEIIKISGIDPLRAQTGKTRAFLKSDAYVDLEQLKRDKLVVHAAIVQAYARAVGDAQRARQQVLAKNKKLVDALRDIVRTIINKEADETRQRADIEAEAAAQQRVLYEDLMDKTAELHHDRMLALEREAEEARFLECAEVEEEWFEHGLTIVEDEDRLRRSMMGIVEQQLATLKREQQSKMMKAAEEATRIAHQAKLKERQQRAENVRAAKDNKMAKIQEQSDKEKRKADAAERRRLEDLRLRKEKILQREMKQMVREEEFQSALNCTGRLGGGKLLTPAEKETRDKREWARMEAHRRKATLENYTRQTWEEMKLADSEFEKHERLQEHRSKQAASEKVRLQREAERKKLEENKRREEAEQRRLEQQVARIRNREVEKGSRLVKEREIMRKRAERREWQLLQDYFTNKSEHETLEKKRTAESHRQKEEQRASMARRSSQSPSPSPAARTTKKPFVPLTRRLGSPEPFSMVGGNLSMSPR